MLYILVMNMKMKNEKKGFTLVELLVVIAIISVLVSMIVPAVSDKILQARAATDAANLRNVLGQINTLLVGNDKFTAATASQLKTAESITFPDAKTYVLYCDSHFVKTYYVIGTSFYSVEYFAEIAASGSSDEPTTQPVPPAGSNQVYEWFEAGVGAVTEEDGE